MSRSACVLGGGGVTVVGYATLGRGRLEHPDAVEAPTGPGLPRLRVTRLLRPCPPPLEAAAQLPSSGTLPGAAQWRATAGPGLADPLRLAMRRRLRVLLEELALTLTLTPTLTKASYLDVLLEELTLTLTLTLP